MSAWRGVLLAAMLPLLSAAEVVVEEVDTLEDVAHGDIQERDARVSRAVTQIVQEREDEKRLLEDAGLTPPPAVPVAEHDLAMEAIRARARAMGQPSSTAAPTVANAAPETRSPPSPAGPKDVVGSIFKRKSEQAEGGKEQEAAVTPESPPRNAVSAADTAVKAFSFGIVEELVGSVKGRLPCPAPNYVLSHYGWLVGHKSGLVIDVGSNANGYSLTRMLAATFPDRDVLAVDSAGSPASSSQHLPDNVVRRSEPGRVTDAMVEGHKVVSVAAFSCGDVACVSAGLVSLRPLLKPGSLLVFTRLVGFPGYLDGPVQALFATMETLPEFGFEVVGGRFVDQNTGATCLQHNPRTEVCQGGVALRVISASGRVRLKGGHLLPTAMPVVAPVCAGAVSAEEVLTRQAHGLNASLAALKTLVNTHIASLVKESEGNGKHSTRLALDVRRLEARLQVAENSVSILICLALILVSLVGVLIHRTWSGARSKATWMRN
eukprot:Rhum_TRINITY_DN17036_c0_g1::Rhum_TRINITY_DN17036_c0_g1_i1::g.165004::m.165004